MLTPYLLTPLKMYKSGQPNMHNFQAHIDGVHRGIKNFLCTLCASAFTFQKDLRKHIEAVHEKKKPYDCTLCEAKFAEKHSLKSHIKSVHEKLRPFICEFCNQSFSRKYHLKTHVDKAHPEKFNKYEQDARKAYLKTETTNDVEVIIP